jgi:hypothetical protein
MGGGGAHRWGCLLLGVPSCRILAPLGARISQNRAPPEAGTPNDEHPSLPLAEPLIIGGGVPFLGVHFWIGLQAAAGAAIVREHSRIRD